MILSEKAGLRIALCAIIVAIAFDKRHRSPYREGMAAMLTEPSSEAVRDHYANARDGDPEARRVVLQQHLGLLYTIAADYEIPQAEAVSAGVDGLLRAIRFFDPQRGEFGRFAAWLIRQEIRNHIKAPAKLPATSLDDTPAHEAPEEQGNLIDVIPDEDLVPPDEMVSRSLDIEAIKNALSRLGSSDREVVSLYFGLNGHSRHTIRALAAKYEISRQSLHSWIRRLVAQLRAELVQEH